MRILLVLEPGSGGAGRHVIDLAAGLVERSHDVTLIYSMQRAEPWFIDALAQLPKMTKRDLQMERSVGLHDVAAVRALRKLVDELGPFDIMHGHSSKAGALLRLATSGKSRNSTLYTPHAPITMDPELGAGARLIYGTAERLLARRCARVICVSEAERAHLLKLGLRPDKLRVVCNGIAPLPDYDRDKIRQRLGIDTNTVCFGFVGRVSHQKAVDRIISAFAMANGQMANAHLVIVGDGPLLEEARELAQSFGVARQVTFTGSADGTEMMAAFDVFVLPSRYEAMPYVLLEAAASGLPIVATDVGGAQDVIRDGESGYIIPEQDVEMLADRLAELVRNPVLRLTMTRNSANAARRFDLDRMVDETVDVYRELPGAPAPADIAPSSCFLREKP